METDELVSERGDATRRDGAASQKKLAETHSNIHVVNQTNALLRERLAGKSQPATLTRENLMMLEDNLEHNRPAVSPTPLSSTIHWLRNNCEGSENLFRKKWKRVGKKLALRRLRRCS